MDRFVWFVLLVVISHLVTEFTRVTGYTRGTRPDVVMVNDSLIQPIKVQNLVLYPGQEYGHYAQQNQQYYNGSNLYSNYASNLFSSLFNTNNNKNNNNNNGQELSGNIIGQNEQQGDVKTFSFQPIIDSIFEIPISTLRAVNNLVARLTGSFQHQHQQQQEQPQQLLPQQQLPQYPSSLYYGGMQKSTGTIKPKTEFEMLNRIRQPKESSQSQVQQRIARAATTVAPIRKVSTSMEIIKKSWLKHKSS